MQPPKLSNVRALIESVQPLHDFVLVKISPEDAGYPRLVLPDSVRGGHMRPGLKHGKVVAVGRGDRFTSRAVADGKEASRKRFEGDRLPMHVNVGDEVIWSRTPANLTLIEGDVYVFVHEEAVFGIIESDDAELGFIDDDTEGDDPAMYADECSPDTAALPSTNGYGGNSEETKNNCDGVPAG